MKPNQHSAPTTDELKRYAAGELSPAEQHELEKRLLKYPLESAAAEGFEQLHADGLSPEAALQDLRQRLRRRIEHPPKRTTAIPLWRYASVAAGVLVVLSVGFWLWLPSTSPEAPTLSKAVERIELEAPSTDSTAEAIEQADQQGLALSQAAPTAPVHTVEPKSALNPQTEVLSAAEGLPQTAESSTPPSAPAPTGGTSPPAAPAAAPIEAMAKEATSAILTAKGQVLDSAEKVPLPGVTVNVAGTNKGTITDSNGRFSIPSLQPGQRLMLNMMGYRRHEVVVQNEAMPTVLLRPDTNRTLAEVVSIAASKKSNKPASTKLLAITPPQPPRDFEQYLRSTLQLPEAARLNRVSGVVEVSFEVDTKGRLSNFVVRQSLGYGCDQEAIRVLKQSPRWTPAERQGKRVAQAASWQIRF